MRNLLSLDHIGPYSDGSTRPPFLLSERNQDTHIDNITQTSRVPSLVPTVLVTLLSLGVILIILRLLLLLLKAQSWIQATTPASHGSSHGSSHGFATEHWRKVADPHIPNPDPTKHTKVKGKT